MIEYRTTKTLTPKKITCDCCKKSYIIDELNHPELLLEVQEFVRIAHYGGYSSIFGDGGEIECDICQECFKLILGKFMPEKLKNLED